ncbi:hypothetical protein L2E82_04763 [Cichorium intybus]|uniref:Uncharacterized protein n=1 Tax=Cichorium intybus TaxID=13427 RepID=A0ACB9H5X3_CICIN|nr:hypothetical protein L2E82_04763 [Cichorium intybus]
MQRMKRRKVKELQKQATEGRATEARLRTFPSTVRGMLWIIVDSTLISCLRAHLVDSERAASTYSYQNAAQKNDTPDLNQPEKTSFLHRGISLGCLGRSGLRECTTCVAYAESPSARYGIQGLNPGREKIWPKG